MASLAHLKVDIDGADPLRHLPDDDFRPVLVELFDDAVGTVMPRFADGNLGMTIWCGGEGTASYQGAEMLTHHALEMLNRRTGLTKVR